MMVNDFDDERTLEEEEALERDEEEDEDGELDDLQKEAEVPLEELLAMYGYGAAGAGPATAGTAMQPSLSATPPSSTSSSSSNIGATTTASSVVLQQHSHNLATEGSDLLSSTEGVDPAHLLPGNEDHGARGPFDEHPSHALGMHPNGNEWRQFIKHSFP